MSKRVIGWAGFVGFGLLCAWSAAYTVPHIRSDLESRSAVALLAARLPLDEVVFDGRNAILTRSLAEPELAPLAIEVLQTVRGIRSIEVQPGARRQARKR